MGCGKLPMTLRHGYGFHRAILKAWTKGSVVGRRYGSDYPTQIECFKVEERKTCNRMMRRNAEGCRWKTHRFILIGCHKLNQVL